MIRFILIYILIPFGVFALKRGIPIPLPLLIVIAVFTGGIGLVALLFDGSGNDQSSDKKKKVSNKNTKNVFSWILISVFLALFIYAIVDIVFVVS